VRGLALLGLSRKLGELERLKAEQSKPSHPHHHHGMHKGAQHDSRADRELTPEQRIVRRIEDAVVFVKNVRVEGGSVFVDHAGLKMMGKESWLQQYNFNPRVQGEALLGELDRQIVSLTLSTITNGCSNFRPTYPRIQTTRPTTTC